MRSNGEKIHDLFNKENVSDFFKKPIWKEKIVKIILEILKLLITFCTNCCGDQ